MNKGLIDRTKLSAIADAIREKNGAQNTYTPDEMATAIAAIQTDSTVLPELDTPAAATDIVAGKEVINGSGEKLTGTMPKLTESGIAVSQPDANGIVEVELDCEDDIHYCDEVLSKSLQITPQAAAAMDENIAAGNIRQGVSIFGIEGTCKRITTESGTYTQANDDSTTNIPCTAGAKAFVLKAPDSAYTQYAAATFKVFQASGSFFDIPQSVQPQGWDAAEERGTAVMRNGSLVMGLSIARIWNDSGITVTMMTSTAKFIGGVTYEWTAYYWED